MVSNRETEMGRVQIIENVQIMDTYIDNRECTHNLVHRINTYIISLHVLYKSGRVGKKMSKKPGGG